MWDGKTNPVFPVIFGDTQGFYSATFNSHKAAAGVALQSVYLSTNDLDLIGNWKGTTDGYADQDNDSARLVTTPSWNDATSSTANYCEIGIVPGLDNRDPTRTYSGLGPETSVYTHHHEDGKWQVYKNALRYSPHTSPTAALTVIDETTWGSTFGFHYSTQGANFANSKNWTNNQIWENGSDFDGHTIDGNDIYILNYESLMNAINTCIVNNQPYLNDTYLNNGALLPIFRAIENAAEFDPYAYDYDSNVKNAAKAAGERIEELIDELVNVRPNAIDAQVEDLDRAIEIYETKMNSKQVWSNMEPAYKAYIVAREYSDAYHYGKQEEFEPSVKEVAFNLTVATNNMQLRSNEYEYVPATAFANDVAYEDKSPGYVSSFSNLVYSKNVPVIEGVPGSQLVFPRDVETLFYNEATVRNTGELSYLIVPKTVAVYDGDNATDVMKVPALLGFMAFGGRVLDNNSRYIKSFWSTSDKLTFNSSWMTANNSTGYTTNASLNEIMKDSKPALGYSSNDTWYESITRCDQAGGEDDPLVYFANTITVGKPDNFSTAASNNLNKYLYQYTTIPVGMKVYDVEGKSDRTTLSSSRSVDYSGQTSISGSSSIGNKAVLFEGGISIYVINYQPVRAILNNNASYIQSADFDIRNYVEGGLHTYLTDMDALTNVDPRNYNYSNDYAGQATQCATDIMNLINSTPMDETTAPEDNEPLGIYKDTTTAPGGAYNDLIELLKIANFVERDCQAPKLYEAFEQKLSQARAKITEITGSSSSTQTNTNEYATGDSTAAQERIAAVNVAITLLNEAIDAMNVDELLGHRFVYDAETDNNAEFVCSVVNTHVHGTDVDMYTYNQLQVVYNTMDLTKYNDTSVILEGKDAFDDVKTEPTEPIFLSDASEYINEGTPTWGTYEAGIQQYVDEGIAALLTAINVANGDIADEGGTQTDEKVNDHTVTFNVVKADGTTVNGYFDDAATNPSASKSYKYGTVAHLDSKSNSIYRWAIKSLDDTVSADALTNTKLIPNTASTLDIQVQSNVTVTAYEVPAKTADQYYVDITDYYGDTIYKVVCNGDEAINYTRVDGASYLTVTINGNEYNVPDYTNYRLTGYPFASGTAVSEIANDSTKTATVKPNAQFNDDRTDYSVSIDNTPITTSAWYDYRAHVKTDISNAYAIAVKINNAVSQESYVPVAYANDYIFYVNRDIDFFTIVKDPSTGGYSLTDNGNVVTFTDETIKLYLDKKLPFTASAIVPIGEKNVTKTMHTVLPEGSGVKVTEAGTLYSNTAGLTEETFVEGADGVRAEKAKHIVAPGNQYGLSIAKSSTNTYYTRSYIKFTYTYNGATIDAIYYGAINTISPTA